MTLVKNATNDIQVMIDRAYDEIRTTGHEQSTIDPNAGGDLRGATGGSHSPSPSLRR